MTLVVSGADEEAEGPRTRVSFRCTMHVEESGSDWVNALERAKAAFLGTHPVGTDLFSWSVSNRTGQMLVSLETTIIDGECRISASMRTRTVSELVLDAVLVLESEEWAASEDQVAEEAGDAFRALFARDAVALAPFSPGGGIVLSSVTIDSVLQNEVVRVDAEAAADR